MERQREKERKRGLDTIDKVERCRDREKEKQRVLRVAERQRGRETERQIDR